MNIAIDLAIPAVGPLDVGRAKNGSTTRHYRGEQMPRHVGLISQYPPLIDQETHGAPMSPWTDRRTDVDDGPAAGPTKSATMFIQLLRKHK